jgi:mannosyltransferase
VTGCAEPDTSQPRANAAFVVLARNKELEGVIQSVKSIERHFNRWYHYPYVFLNDQDFNSTFKETIQNYTSAPCEFGTIDPSMWGFPDWIDPKVAKEGIAKQGDAAIMYGGMESYHAMCRFYSGYANCHKFFLQMVRGVLTDIPDSFTNMSFWLNTSGTGVWSQRLSISVILHSMSWFSGNSL